MKDQRNSLALIVPGGIGTGANNIGVPVLERLVLLLAKDFQITVFSIFKVNDDYLPVGFELICVTAKTNASKFLKLRKAFAKKHKERPFVAVHGFWALPSGFYAVLLGRMYNVRRIVSILGGDAIALPQINYGQLQRWFPRNLIMWTLNHASEVIVLTQYLWDNLKVYGFERKEMRIIPWGIDTDLFAFREKPAGSTVKFLHVANLHPVKDQHTLIHAFKIISDQVPSNLIIVGEGVFESEVRSLVESLGISNKVTFMKPVPYEDLVPIYRDADVLLHTSLSEGQSEVVTEAMSSGLLVCGTRVGLLYDIPDCCVSVAVADYRALASETLKALKDPAMINRLKNNAREWTRLHSIYWTVEQLKECYAHA